MRRGGSRGEGARFEVLEILDESCPLKVKRILEISPPPSGTG